MVEERKCHPGTILCKCGHPLNHHASGAGECYSHTRKTEKKKNHLGDTVKVKCVYECTCKKFELSEPSYKPQKKSGDKQ